MINTNHPNLVTLLLFIIALIPRLPGLDRFLTSDENTNIFLAGSDVVVAFLRGDLRGTYWHFYPGVTMSWLDGLGMAGQYGLEWLGGRSLPAFTEYVYGDILSLVVANRIPYALLTAAAVAAIYRLTRLLLPQRVALLGALFLAFDPFLLAHSRVAHGDAPVAVFMALSALAFLGFLQQYRQNPAGATADTSFLHPLPGSKQALFYLTLSAVCGGLAALTKAPGQFMAIFVAGLSLLYAGLDLYALRTTSYASRITYYVLRIILRWLTVIALWGFISLAVFVVLWPSMWVDPVGTLRQMLDETFGKVNEGHLVYFFGQPTLDPGPWFYLYVIPFRLTPVILLGSFLSLLLFIPRLNRLTPSHSSLFTRHSSSFSALLLLWLFIVTLLLFGNLSPKKQDRYLLPLFPFLNLLAAVGWLNLFNLIFYSLKSRLTNFPISHSPTLPISSSSNLPISSSFMTNYQLLITTLLLLLHLLPVLTYYPYYLTYFNPLMGGPVRAAQTTLMGWGEGMEQAAAYLNSKPDAQNLYVASTPSQTLLPYFKGTGENFYTNDIALRADYVVLYLAQRQRLAPSAEIVRYFEAQKPEKIITIKGIPYAKIYPGPKLILSDIPPQATPANIGLDNILRLAGYQLPNARSSTTNNQLPITLYWHALAPISQDYTISVRARAAGGALLAQQDQWPVDGLLPTSQWRQGDYVVDTHSLKLSAEQAAQFSHFEIVVYNAQTGQTLGPPLTINNEQ